MGELWSVFCEDSIENWRDNGTTLYVDIEEPPPYLVHQSAAPNPL